MISEESVVINRCCESHKDRIGAYRLLNNDNWCVGDVVEAMASACSASEGPPDLPSICPMKAAPLGCFIN